MLAADKALAGSDEETDWVLREWARTLTLLASDRSQLVGQLDWVTKLWLLETFAREERVRWDDPWLASLDLEYHNIDPDRGLFFGLESEGKVFRLTTDADIQRAMTVGPCDTRGGIRGLCVRRFREQIQSIQWERVKFTGGILPKTLDMSDLFEPAEVQELAAVLENASSPIDALRAWGQRKEQLR